MKITRWIGAITALTMGALNGQDVVGDWNGKLQVTNAELRLVLHIAKADRGALQATLDSVDQPGANGMPVNSITLKDSKLKLTIDAIQGTYEGTVNEGATRIAGRWSQGSPLPLDFQRGTIKTEHKPAKPSDIDGEWSGTLDMGSVTLRILFHIINTEDGLTATADSPDQDAKGMPVTSVTRNGSALKLEMKALAAEFEGKISEDLKTVTGTFTQNGRLTPLVLSRN